MFLRECLNKKIKYMKNMGDKWYWDYRFIVQIDKVNYCLINYQDSVSGWIRFQMECVDVCFIDNFFKDPWSNDYVNFEKVNIPLKEYCKYEDELQSITNIVVPIIPITKIEKYLNLFEGGK